MKITRLFLSLCLGVLAAFPIAVFAQGVIGSSYNHGYEVTTISPGGIISDPHTPAAMGTPGDVGVPSTTGNVPAIGVVSLTSPTLVDHLLLKQDGVGDNCSAGLSQVVSWSLDPNLPVANKDDMLKVIATAETSDQRLREVSIFDDQIDLYYLQPAYRYGFIPENYYLHIGANGNSLRISIEKPTWVGNAKNYHAVVTQAFEAQIPQILNQSAVDQIQKLNLIARDAVMIEIIASVMHQVPVEPIANSFFVCYIIPFLAYILLAIAIAAVCLWFLVRRLRRKSGYQIHKVKLYGNERDAEETDSDPDVMHFRPRAPRKDETEPVSAKSESVPVDEDDDDKE